MTVLSLAGVIGLGLILGSFANVCIVRLPAGESVVMPRSHCRRCGLILRWWENIPIVSYLLLKGHCRRCRNPISLQYPVIEGLSALLAVAVFKHYQSWGPTLVALVGFFIPLLTALVIDWRHLVLPDVITLPGAAAGLLFRLLFPLGERLDAIVPGLIGAALGLGLTWTVAALYKRIRHQEGLGGGDVKLTMMLGAWLGWEGVLGVLFLASLIGTVAGGAWLWVGRRGRSTPIPFGPFLIGAAFLFFFRGREWVQGYLNWTQSFIY